ncbi:MAG: hypothetical protein ACWA5Q_09740 [bacterium]
MNKTKFLSIMLVVTLVVTGSVLAGGRHGHGPNHGGKQHNFVDRARVVDVVPVYREREHRPRHYKRSVSFVGDGQGNKAAVVKSGTKGKITSDHRYDEDYHYPDYYREVVGYRVKYRFRDHKYWTFMHQRPGKYIDVHVNITPVG